MDVVFDLDGTLIDSKAGIVDCLRSALIEHGLAWTEPLDWCIGPPAELCMEHLLPTESPATREHIVRMYREHYQRRGWKNSHLYPESVNFLVSFIAMVIDSSSALRKNASS